jgi:hypothetical protein
MALKKRTKVSFICILVGLAFLGAGIFCRTTRVLSRWMIEKQLEQKYEIENLHITAFTPVRGTDQTAFRDYIDVNDLDKAGLTDDVYTFLGKTSDGKNFDGYAYKNRKVICDSFPFVLYEDKLAAELEGIVEDVSDDPYDIDMDLYSEFAGKPESYEDFKRHLYHHHSNALCIYVEQSISDQKYALLLQKLTELNLPMDMGVVELPAEEIGRLSDEEKAGSASPRVQAALSYDEKSSVRWYWRHAEWKLCDRRKNIPFDTVTGKATLQ